MLSIDEFQSPYVKSSELQEGRNRTNTLIDLESNYIPRLQDSIATNTSGSFTSNFINLFEMIEVRNIQPIYIIYSHLTIFYVV